MRPKRWGGGNDREILQWHCKISRHHGQIWNGSEVAASLGIAPNTARSHLDALEQTFMVRRLPPWHANLGKRLVKTPKIYFRDSGLFHTDLKLDRLNVIYPGTRRYRLHEKTEVLP